MTNNPKYLLDTNVISETRLPNPNQRVTSFLQRAGTQSVFLSVLTVGEMRAGAAQKRRSNPVFARRLSAWIDTTEQDFADRILSVDAATANLWGDLSGTRTRPIVDTLLAATAIVHSLVLVTRNTKDVEDIPVTTLNPWLP